MLVLKLKRNVRLTVGRLGRFRFERGVYFYVGSALRGIEARIARHRRLCEEKKGPRHWHIDHLLLHPAVEIVYAIPHPGEVECTLSREIASRPGIRVPVPGFGASDCTAGCPAHLYRLG